MGNFLKNILWLAIMAFLVWYLASRWDQLKEMMLKLSSPEIAAMYLLCFLIALSNAYVVQRLVNVLKTRTRFWDMVWLQNAALLLNYVPVKFGTIFRANYLKRHYGLSYTNFVSFFMYITFLVTAAAAVIGLFSLLMVYGLGGYENKLLAVVFLVTIVGSLFFLFVPLPCPEGQGRVSTILRNFLTSRSQISKQGRTIFVCVIFLTINLTLTALRIGIIYHSMDEDVHWAAFLVLGALGFVALFIGLTPGSLGIRELMLSLGAVVLGIPLEVGVLAAMIDRAVVLSYVFVAGGSCTVWLWFKSPVDFRKL